jgi:hypothetical protein
MLVVSGTYCSPPTKLLSIKDDQTNDDIAYTSLPVEITRNRVRRTLGNSTVNFQEVLKSLGKFSVILLIIISLVLHQYLSPRDELALQAF